MYALKAWRRRNSSNILLHANQPRKSNTSSADKCNQMDWELTNAQRKFLEIISSESEAFEIGQKAEVIRDGDEIIRIEG